MPLESCVVSKSTSGKKIKFDLSFVEELGDGKKKWLKTERVTPDTAMVDTWRIGEC